jgi:hypothetical protein
LEYHGAERRIYSGAAGRLARLFDEAYRTHVRAPHHDGCAAFPHGDHWAGSQACAHHANSPRAPATRTLRCRFE